MEPFFRKSWAIAAMGVWLSVGPTGCQKKEDAAAAPDTAVAKEASKVSAGAVATASPQSGEAPAPSAAGGDGAFDRNGAGGAPKRRAPVAIGGTEERGEAGLHLRAPAAPGVHDEGAWNGPAGAKPAEAPAKGQPLPPPPPVPGLVPIDPNGRFATTYRPGGGHLAAFESAVGRGIIPAGERELVSDVGARYAPAMDAPKGKAITLRTDFERGKLAPSGGPFHVRIALRSTADKPPERPHLSVHLVLDVSGSMAGESITNARAAATALVDKLAPSDDFSLVTFSNDADVKVPDGPVGARRAAIKKIIADIREGGGTNISHALELGYAQAQAKTIPVDAVRVVLLLSDGHANMGITAPERIARLSLDAFQNGVQTSAFGLGPDYDGALMSAIAAEGAGGYYYLRDAQQIAPALATEIDKRLDPVATAVEVRVRLKKDVSLLRVYGSRRLSGDEAARVRAQEVAADAQAEKRDKIKADRQDDAAGGMRFFIPAFAPDDSHALLLQLAVPAGAGERSIAMVEIKYKDRVGKKNVADEFPVKLGYADSDAASGASIDASVARTVQGFAVGETLNDAAGKIARGDRAGALAMLTEREQILRQAAQTLGEPLFLKDADRLARLRGHAGTDTGLGDPLVLSLLLETAGNSHLH
jgi:Ca-activated chloride channel family protein